MGVHLEYDACKWQEANQCLVGTITNTKECLVIANISCECEVVEAWLRFLICS